MRISTSMRWLVVVAGSAAMLLAVAAACSSETVEVPGETVVVEKEVIKTVEVPGETVIQEVVKEVHGARRDRRGRKKRSSTETVDGTGRDRRRREGE